MLFLTAKIIASDLQMCLEDTFSCAVIKHFVCILCKVLFCIILYSMKQHHKLDMLCWINFDEKFQKK